MMQSVVLKADTLNLPSAFAGRYRGRSLRVVDEGERLVLTPVLEKEKEPDIEDENAKSLARYERLAKKYNFKDCQVANSLFGIAADINMTLDEIRAERLSKYERLD
jgi:ATP sulfurylase